MILAIGDAASLDVKIADAIERRVVLLASSLQEPLVRLRVVAFHAVASGVNLAQQLHGTGIRLFHGF